MTCIFRKHRYEHIVNLGERRGLYQCVNCKKLVASLDSGFFTKRDRIEDGINEDRRRYMKANKWN